LIGQSESVLRIVGPALSGILVASAGPGWALGADAATFFVAAGFLSLVRLPFGERPERQTSVIGDFVVGWSFARGLGWVIPVASCSLFFNALISGSIGVLGPVIAENTIGSRGWGFARSSEAAGLFVIAFFLARISIHRPLRTCVLGFTLNALPMLLLGTWVNTAALAAAFFVAGAGLGVISLAWSLTVQEKVPEEMLSRVMAIDGFFSFVAMPIGQIVVGPLTDTFGTRPVELGSVALCLLVCLVGVTRPTISNLRLNSLASTGTAEDV
jgi:MFS family permease